ncbi:MAG: MoxR family ATPase [Oscillospiraceae bacterium]|nr:MoxR family ATPase [Oscillospiraceae bacterium]MCL2278898.1 MoxR family ATPase [Oscillospiraceae bacterium]
MEKAHRGNIVGRRVLNSVMNAIVGKEQIVLRVFLAILARGHILIEDIPGVGKTTLAIAFSRALNLEYNRVQFTPDVLPSDVTGFSIVNKDTGSLEYTPGAVLCNLFLADELNRATSRTQSALLEAMEEGQVTVDGQSHEIPKPFIVIATQNPVGAAGTQLLPDSQMDRFMVRLSLGYPGASDELSLLQRKQGKVMLDMVSPTVTSEELEDMCKDVDKVHVDPTILEYIVTLIGKTRNNPDIILGASPRASIAMVSISKAAAYLQGRDYVVPSDISPLFADTLAHRLVLRPGAEHENMTAEKILGKVLKSVQAPRIG